MTLFLMLIGLFVLIFINIPIAVALAVVAVVAMVLTQGVDILPNVALVMFDGSTKFPLLAIPLFIFAGAIMNTSGISKRLIAFASAVGGSGVSVDGARVGVGTGAPHPKNSNVITIAQTTC